jgi:hypothetical protein
MLGTGKMISSLQQPKNSIGSGINQKNRMGSMIGRDMGQRLPSTVSKPGGTGAAAPPSFVEQPDPRDATYWANRMALETTLGTNLAYLQNEQDRSNASYNENTALQSEYNRRRVRDLAENRLGTGSIYSGSHRRDQRENAYDFMVDERRRSLDKQAADNELTFERNALIGGHGEDLAALEGEGAQRILDRYALESEENPGDSTNVRPKYGRKIKDTNKRIQFVRGKIGDANTPEEKKRLTKQLTILQKRRATLKGKARKDRG